MAERSPAWAGNFDFTYYNSNLMREAVNWLQFIRNVNKDIDSHPFGSGDNVFLGLNPFFTIVAGNHTFHYVEEYWEDRHLVFAVFLDNPYQFTRIECYNREYVEICEKHYASIMSSMR